MGWPMPDKPDTSALPVEFHFQEVFTGQQIDLRVGSKIKARIVVRTKFQTGLAHIEILQLHEGEEVILKIAAQNLETAINVEKSKPYVTVRMIDGQLKVEKTATPPGYL